MIDIGHSQKGITLSVNDNNSFTLASCCNGINLNLAYLSQCILSKMQDLVPKLIWIKENGFLVVRIGLVMNILALDTQDLPGRSGYSNTSITRTNIYY